MPTVTYTNRPELQGQPGTVYAPDLPWWVDQPQPQSYEEQVTQNVMPSEPTESVVGIQVSKSPSAAGGNSLDAAINNLFGKLGQMDYGTSIKDTRSRAERVADLGFKFTPTKYGAGGTTPTSSTTTRRTVFKGERPELELPEFDKGRLRQLRQQAAAPGIRKLRTALNRALVRSYENPNVARMIQRSALAGYGEGLESVLAGAGRTAASEYQAERATDIQERLANFQAAMQEYIGGAETVTETNTGAGAGEDSAQAYRNRQLRSLKASAPLLV